MKRSTWKNTIKALSFVLIGILLFLLFVRVFHFKYSKSAEQFYALPVHSVDVLMVGSSHAYHSLDPDVLYRESGTTAYVMGSASQMVWNSYYFIKEALKRQKPKVILLECYTTHFQKDYSDEPVAIKSACNMPFSVDYIKNLYVSLEDKSKLLDSILMFPWYHSRYTELSEEDVLPYYGRDYFRNFLGYTAIRKRVPATLPEGLERITERRPMTKKVVTYLDKIRDLAKENDAELVLVLAPFCNHAEEYQPFYNSLADYAEQYGLRMINGNFLYDELGLDGCKDFGNGSHLTVSGKNKFSAWLNGYLQANFSLEDHRGDSYYDRWERNRTYMEEEQYDLKP